MGTHPIFESDFDCLTEKKMEFFDRVQPDLNIEKLFTMSHLKRDTRHHLKKVYSALTLTLLAAVGGAVLAKSFPLLANPFLVLGASLYLIFSLAGRQGSNRERLTKLILFGGLPVPDYDHSLILQLWSIQILFQLPLSLL